MALDHMLSDTNTWIDQYGDVLFRFAVARLRNEHLAEEVVQETFIAAFKGRENFQGKSSEQTWLISILKNKIIDYFRKSSKKKIVDFPSYKDSSFDEDGHWRVFEGRGPIDWGPTPKALLERKEFMLQLKDCLSGMPEKFSQVFCNREMDGMKTEEICKVFNISASNVWVILHRARALLRDCLEKNWFFSRVSEEAKGPIMKRAQC